MEKAVENRHIFRAVVFAGTALAVVHLFAVFQDLYRRVLWIDIPMHLWGGAFLALGFYYFFHRAPHYVDLGKSSVVTLVLLLGFAALGGVLWEFGEFLYDQVALYINPLTVRLVQFGLADTMGDLAFDLLGAFVVAIFMQARYYKKRRA